MRAASLQLVNDFARDFYREQLTGSEEGKAIGLSYFKHRGYTDATIAKFALGYAPKSGRALKDRDAAEARATARTTGGSTETSKNK